MNSSVLPKRLKELREKNGYLQKFVADKLGIRSNTLSGYENGTRSPDPDMLLELSELYDVSVDYLLGKTDNPNSAESDEETKKFFIDKIAKEFPDAQLMFHDLANMTAEQMEEVYEFIKFKRSQNK